MRRIIALALVMAVALLAGTAGAARPGDEGKQPRMPNERSPSAISPMVPAGEPLLYLNNYFPTDPIITVLPNPAWIKPWTNGEVFSAELSDYLLAIKLNDDGTHQLVLYGKLTTTIDLLKKAGDALDAKKIADYCTLTAHPVGTNADEATKATIKAAQDACVAKVSEMKIMPWLLIPGAIKFSRVIETDCQVVGDKGYFRCELPKAQLEPLGLTGKSVEEIAKAWKFALSDTVLGSLLRSIVFMGMKDKVDATPLLDAASAIVLADGDADGDAVPNVVDNCKDVANYDQVIMEGAVCDKASVVPDTTQTPADSTNTTAPATDTGVDTDSGGFCALMPMAAANPLGLILMLAAAVPLLLRKRS